MWLDAKSQRRKVIDAAIEVAAYLYKNDNLRIDQRLKVISMCLPSLFSLSAPLIDWSEPDLKLLTAAWVRAYKNAWNLGKSTANCLFTFPRDRGGLQVKLTLGTLFTSVCGNLERFGHFDDGTRQMLALCYQEALQENGCLHLLRLQDASQHLSWKAASTNEVTFACYLANKLDIWVEWDSFHPDLIASAPDATLSTLACQVKLTLLIQVEGVMPTATCLKTGLDSTLTIQVGDRQHSIHLDGQARNPGLPSLRECISRSYGQARWLYEITGMATDPESDEWADGVKTIRIPQHFGIGIGTSRHGPPHCSPTNGSALVGELITHIDSIPTATMNHCELHRALQGPEYTSVSVGVAELQGNAQTISVLTSPPRTSQIRWARAVKPLRDRRRELEKTIRGLTKDEEIECASLSVGEAAFVRLLPKLRAYGFHTFDIFLDLILRSPERSFPVRYSAMRTRQTPCCLPNGWTNCRMWRAMSLT